LEVFRLARGQTPNLIVGYAAQGLTQVGKDPRGWGMGQSGVLDRVQRAESRAESMNEESVGHREWEAVGG